MRDRRTPRIARCVAVLAACVALSACANFPPWFGRADEAIDPVDTELSILGAHLATMRAMNEGSVDEQAAVFEATREAAESVPTSSRRLRLALALAVPGHPASSSATAYRLLTELLGAPDALLESERQLASIQLAELQQRMILEARIARLDEAASKPEPAQPRVVVPRRSAEDIERLRTLEQLNAELAQQLAEARAKLEAVTAIESDVTRNDIGEPPR